MKRVKLIATWTWGAGALLALTAGVLGTGVGRGGDGGPEALGAYVVFGANDLGMHCMQQDFSEFLILPPYNTLHAQVIRRGVEPEIMRSDVQVRYALQGNTRSADKCNFWSYSLDLLGVSLPPDVGLTGNAMSGTMSVTPNGDWQATGIPVTPVDDNGLENSYPLATINVTRGGQTVAQTQAVVPVSWEISCHLCHNQAGKSVGEQVIEAHDRLHGTSLSGSGPVFCAGCHADPALGAPGAPGVSAFSHAMHGAHASRMGQINLQNECYACHPGVRTQCQRDIHSARGMACVDCHGGMAAVGSPTRRPWVDEPRCADCHSRPGFEFEQPGKLFRESVGHAGVTCLACHGSPHAITPTVTEIDNQQAITLQGETGVIRNCVVCHTQQPTEAFFHRRRD